MSPHREARVCGFEDPQCGFKAALCGFEAGASKLNFAVQNGTGKIKVENGPVVCFEIIDDRKMCGGNLQILCERDAEAILNKHQDANIASLLIVQNITLNKLNFINHVPDNIINVEGGVHVLALDESIVGQ